MTSPRRLGRIIGMLLLVHLLTALFVPYAMLLPLTTPPAGFLAAAAGMAAQVRLSVLLLFVGGALSVAISVAVWPALRERSYRLGLWVLVLAVVNFTLLIVEIGHWLTMLSVSQAYAEAGAAGAGAYQSLGMAIRSAFRWAHFSHLLVAVSWLFTLYWLLFRCAAVPRALAAFGMAASLLQIGGVSLPVFAGYRMFPPEIVGTPLGLATLVLSAWLMAKGFREPNALP
jgi:hypothetical protein